MGENRGEGPGLFGADDISWNVNRYQENVPVEEENGAERLVLRGSGDILFGGQMGEKRLDFRRAHFTRVALVVEEDIAFDPFFIGLLGAIGIVFEANGIANLLEDFLALWSLGSDL